ncbi:hypothetical protein MHU86_24613 [Fragilaria crotonensis]|nr:hypothetical protein MHU86_24613 [Fragilaria crotonensis]
MSEEELAAAIGAISVVAGIVGSIVGSRLLGGGGGGGSTSRSAASSFSLRQDQLSEAWWHLTQQRKRPGLCTIRQLKNCLQGRSSEVCGSENPSSPGQGQVEETFQRHGFRGKFATGSSSTSSSTMNQIPRQYQHPNVQLGKTNSIRLWMLPRQQPQPLRQANG